MTNKRKKLARSISKKTGVSYAGAINLMTRQHSEWESLFVEDPCVRGEHELPGGFVRADNLMVYEKAPEEVVYVIGEEGENILAIQKAKKVILPIARYEGTPDYIQKAISERMEALIETAAIQCLDQVDGTVPVTVANQKWPDHEKFFQAAFGSLEGVTLKKLSDKWVGIKGKAGIFVQAYLDPDQGLPTTIAGQKAAGVGLAVWGNRIRACSCPV